MMQQEDYNKLAGKTDPQMPKALTFEVVIKTLKQLFGHRETKFSLQRQLLAIEKKSDETFCDYAIRVNRASEKFDIKQCSADDLKNLAFVNGLRDPQDSLILEKLLAKTNAQYVQLEAAETDGARNAIKKLNLDSLVNEAERLISLKKDKAEVGSSSKSPTSGVFAIKSEDKKQKPKQKNASGKPSSPKSNRKFQKPPRPCRFCESAEHWESECDYKGRCDTCGSVGHKTGRCADAKSESSSAGRRYITPSVNGAKIRLQVDSASDITIISRENWKRLGEPTISSAGVMPGSASGGTVHLHCKFECNMKLKGRQESVE